MGIMQQIERRMMLPDDSETERSRKSLAIILLALSAFFTGINALRYYRIGLADIAASYFVLSAVSLIVFLFFIFFRRSSEFYTPLAVLVLTTSFVCNTAAHLLGGGYTSGLMIIQWTIVSLVLSVLLLDRRWVYVMIALFVALLIAAGLLETAVRGRVPPLDPGFIALDATFVMLLMGLMVMGACLYLFNQVERYRARADDLLLNILPGSIASRLKENPGTIADGFSEATVLFADIVDFTTMSSTADPVDVVNKLNEVFSNFDELAARHGLEKIKTIGDAYMVAGGLPQPQPDHCRVVAAFAVDMVAAMAKHVSWTGEPMRIRVGINTGPVVAGVIGRQKFIYDLWGDAVNVASRMESNGLSNEIQVTQAVKERLDGLYVFEERGPIPVKGKGEMVTYLLRTKQ
jgi:class 3 adenylate cyclase